MKKIASLLLAAGLLVSVATMAQGGGGQRQPMTVPERVTRTIERLKPELSLDEKQVKDIEPVYTEFYTEMDKLRGSGQMPSPEQRQKLADARDEKLKKILSADQMKKLKEMEEQMRQRRPQ